MSRVDVWPCEASGGLDAVLALWDRCMLPEWPLDLEALGRVLLPQSGHHEDHFAAFVDGRMVGFVAAPVDRRRPYGERTGSISLLLVSPEHRLRGVGAVLHERALGHFREEGASSAVLGASTPMFWAGVPHNLPGALAFFRAMGWSFTGHSIDMSRDVRGYRMPEDARRRMDAAQVVDSTAASEDLPELFGLVAREFPGWLDVYRGVAALDDLDDLLIFRDGGGRVIGSLVMSSPRSHPSRTDCIWTALLGQDAGALGCVGISADSRGRGLGLAIVARASEILGERGVGQCYIAWTHLAGFYARLGYKVWREFAISRRTLNAHVHAHHSAALLNDGGRIPGAHGRIDASPLHARP